MEEKLKQHFDEFYNRLVFLDSYLGEEEQTFTEGFYLTINQENSGKLVRSLVFEENLKDEQIYIRHKGLVLTLVYGGWYNKKHKEIDAYITKDPYYHGSEEGSVDELLSLLDDYIVSHYKEFYEKINKIIYGKSEDIAMPIKYRPANILSKENLKTITIRDATIKNKDIEHLKRYPNLRELKISNSKIVANNIGTLMLSALMIMNSDIESIFCLDHISSKLLSIYNSKFKSTESRAITIDAEDFSLDDIEGLDMSDFFICTNFRNLKKANFNNIELTPLEVSLLPVLYNIIELEASGKATSYNFLNELPELEYFSGIIKLVDDKVLYRLSEKYKEKLDKHNIKEKEQINNYILFQLTDVLSKYKKFWNSIRLSKIALVKFKGMIENSNEEYIKSILALPLSYRKHLGEEHDINFIEALDLDPYHLMLNKFHDRYLSKIIGRDGKRLMKPLQIGYSDFYYILGADGKIMETIRKTEARDVTVPEHYEEVRNEIVENNNNIFDYYYNRTFDEPTKLGFLSKKIMNLFDTTIDSFKIPYDKNSSLIEKRKELESLEDQLLGISVYDLFNSDLSILMYSPRHQLVERESIRKGKTVTVSEHLPDDFIEEDINLYHALKRTRNPRILDYSLSEIYEEENINKEKQERIKKGIQELLRIWEEMEKLDKEIIDEDVLISEFVEKSYPEITKKIKRCDYPHWFLTDIEEFLSQFNFSNEEYGIFYNYILIIQCRNRYNYLKELDRLENREYVLKECYSVDSIINYVENYTDFVDYETSLKKGDMSQKEYNLVKEFMDIIEQEEEIRKILDIYHEARLRTYEEMIPLIDSLDVQQLTEIKENMIITNENKVKFDKFVDYLYFYFYHDVPPWMKLELAKCPHLEDKYTSKVSRKLVKEETFHIDEHVKIDKGIFSF